jgi:hypothetical protein
MRVVARNPALKIKTTDGQKRKRSKEKEKSRKAVVEGVEEREKSVEAMWR